MITQQQALEALDGIAAHYPRASGEAYATLRQYIEQQAGDAELLDWLEAQDLNDIAVIRQTNNVVGINVGHGPAYGKTLRAAIRAAMAQERKA